MRAHWKESEEFDRYHYWGEARRSVGTSLVQSLFDAVFAATTSTHSNPSVRMLYSLEGPWSNGGLEEEGEGGSQCQWV